MEEKLLGSIVVSYYGPFTKGEADLMAEHFLDEDPSAVCIGGTCKDGSEVLTVLCRHGDDPEMEFGQFMVIAHSLLYGSIGHRFSSEPEVE